MRRFFNEVWILIETAAKKVKKMSSEGKISTLNDINRIYNETYLPAANALGALSFLHYVGGLKERSRNISFSCAYDYLMFKYLERFAPASNYVRLRRRIKKNLRKIENLFQGYSAGKNDRKNFSKICADIERDIRIVRQISGFNEKLQKIFWNTYFHPFRIDIDERVRINVKLNYFPI